MRYADCHPERQHYGKGQCRPCYAVVWRQGHLAHISAQKRAAYRRDPERFIAAMKKSLYGITREEYDAMVARQEGKCLVCLQELYIDHDHATGKIRGLLCNRCNAGLGFLGDDVERVRAAARYLETGQ